MQADSIMSILRVFLIVVGGLTAIWGIYDMFGDGQQSSVGIKKLIGGIAFAAIAGIMMTWAIKEVGAVQAQAGISGMIRMARLLPLVRF